jgi:hypothetical protein
MNTESPLIQMDQLLVEAREESFIRTMAEHWPGPLRDSKAIHPQYYWDFKDTVVMGIDNFRSMLRWNNWDDFQPDCYRSIMQADFYYNRLTYLTFLDAAYVLTILGAISPQEAHGKMQEFEKEIRLKHRAGEELIIDGMPTKITGVQACFFWREFRDEYHGVGIAFDEDACSRLKEGAPLPPL